MYNIEKLYALPQKSRVEGENEGEGGYDYPEKYQNNLYIYENKVILFEKRTHHEYPIALIDAILEAASNNTVTETNLLALRDSLIEDFNEKLIEVTKELETLVYESSNDTENKIINIHTQLDVFTNKIDSLNKALATVGETLDSLTSNNIDIASITADVKKHTQEIVGKEVDDLYSNFEKEISNMIAKEVQTLKDTISKSENKIKPVQYMMYKEMGMSMEEIIRLKESNLL